MASPFRAGKLCACCLLLLTVSGSNAQQGPRVTGFFTDMRYIQEAGDVIGTELWIVYARGAYWATVQIAEGEPDPPVVVPVRVSGPTVKFTLRMPLVDQNGKPAPDTVFEFAGTVSRDGLRLDSGPFGAVMLKRRNSYWQ
jgi:hypothetical protein